MAEDITSFLRTTGRLKKNLRFEANSDMEETIKEWVQERQEVAIRVLKDEGNYSTGALANSIEPKPFERDENSIIVKILANSYWDFINKGVNGVMKTQNSKYSFKNLGVGRNMRRSFEDFIKNRGIKQLRYRDSSGETKIKQLQNASDYRSVAYVLARATKKKGIEGNHFMDIAFSEQAIQDLSQRLEREVVKIFE